MYVRSKADEMASLIYSARNRNEKNKEKLETKTE